MSRNLRLTYLTHSLRSDWNNGNAHFLRGLLSSMQQLGHTVEVLEPEHEWSINNLRDEPEGQRSLDDFRSLYPALPISTYPAGLTDLDHWRSLLHSSEIVILHEWNPPALALLLLDLRDELGFRLLFHDTHHRASSSPEQIAAFGLPSFDGVIVFGEVLRSIYRDRFGMDRVWVLHEAADTTIFRPLPTTEKDQDAVWIGNWGDNERSAEIAEFFLEPAAALAATQFTIYGVRYPPEGLAALAATHVRYGGYLPNLDAPRVYSRSRLTVHIPRQQYSTVMIGIPTIRIFEALACGIPLLSAPWQDTESLFRPGDIRFVSNGHAMTDAMTDFLNNPAKAHDYAMQGRDTVLARHTCDHRARELTAICEEHLS